LVQHLKIHENYRLSVVFAGRLTTWNQNSDSLCRGKNDAVSAP